MAKPQGDQLLSRLKTLTTAIARSEEAKQYAETLLKVIGSQVKDSVSCSIITGPDRRDRVRKPETGTRLYSAYKDELAKGSPSRPTKRAS